MDDEFVKEDLAEDQDSKLSPPRIEQEQVDDMRTLESIEGFREGCWRDVDKFSIESNKESPSSISSKSLAVISAQSEVLGMEDVEGMGVTSSGLLI